MTAALLLAAAVAAGAQSPMPTAPQDGAAATNAAPPAASTDTVAASTAAAAVVVSTGGAKVAGEVKAKLTRPIRATIHAEAKDWEPVALKPGGDPEQAATAVTVKLAKVKGKYKGTATKAKSFARRHKDGADAWLVYSIFPAALERRRGHFEVRLRIVEGFVEDAKAAAVFVVDRRRGAGAGLDSFEMRERGVAYEEDFPSSGAILISALDPRPSKGARNSGALQRAAFPDKELGLVDASWSATGLK